MLGLKEDELVIKRKVWGIEKKRKIEIKEERKEIIIGRGRYDIVWS